jgi:hypothetical protein
MMTLLCEKKNILDKSKEVKTRRNLADCSKESYGSTSAVLPIVVAVAYLFQGVYSERIN